MKRILICATALLCGVFFAKAEEMPAEANNNARSENRELISASNGMSLYSIGSELFASSMDAEVTTNRQFSPRARERLRRHEENRTNGVDLINSPDRTNSLTNRNKPGNPVPSPDFPDEVDPDNDEWDIDPDDWNIPDPVIPGQGNVVPGVVPEVPYNNNGANGGNTENNDPKTDFSMSMYSVGGSGLENATANAGIDTPLIPVADTKKLESALKPVQIGLMADGVTPLVFKIHIPGKAEKDTKWKLNLKWNRQVVRAEPKFYVLQKGKYLLAKAAKGGNDFSLSFTLPKHNNGVDLYAYLEGVESDAVVFPKKADGHYHSVTLFDANNKEKVKRSFLINKPPLVLVHGFNTIGEWGDEYKKVLAEERGGSDPIEVHYGVLDVIPGDGAPEKDTGLNTYKTFEGLVKLLDTDLKQNIEGKAGKAPCWDGYACTRYDVLAHSQGGVLIRMLCSEKDVWGRGKNFCNADNHYRGRFHRIVTLGSPQNGSSIAYFGWKLSQHSPTVAKVAEWCPQFFVEKFNPWGEQIRKINSVEVDSRAKFHAIRTRFLSDDLTGSDRETLNIVAPKGSDGIVDMESQRAGDTKGSLYEGDTVLHFTIFANTGQTGYPPLAKYAASLFNDKKNFGPFVIPAPASGTWKGYIDEQVSILSTTEGIIRAINFFKKLTSPQ